MVDAFEQWRQEQQAKAIIASAKEHLLEDARERRMLRPDEDWVGFVMAPDAPDARRIQEALEDGGYAGVEGAEFFSALVLRAVVVEMLRSNCPQLQEHMLSSDDAFCVVAATRSGYQAAGVGW